MKKSLLFFLFNALILFSCNDEKQIETTEADAAAIKQQMKSYAEAFSRSDWPSLIKLVHPDVFKYIAKADFEKEFEETFNKGDHKIRITGIKIDSIYATIQRNSRKYSLVKMTTACDMIFNDSSEIERPDDYMDKLCEGIKEEMGQEFVSCISTPNGVEFSAIEYCYVVYIPENKKWFYLTNTDESAVLVNKIIPAEIREKLHR